MRQVLSFYLLIICCITAHTDVCAQTKIVVAADGTGDSRTIQGAINLLSDSASSMRIVFIKNGIYHEKIYLEKHHVILEGESRDKTIIIQSIARDEWRCSHNNDWGVATLNVDGSDITFKNLSVINNFGFEDRKETTIECPMDSSARDSKKINANSHQMAVRTMNTTRFKAINCRFRAYGGDTVSPWNVRDGMFYFKDCIMEGGVDFYAPRGWAYAENCLFITHSGDAAIWHDGSAVKDSKTVLKNCSFEGIDNFKLGRFHRDAQFYLVNCNFASNMANEDIYLVPTGNQLQWGRRIYYYNCHKKNGDYTWFADNLASASEKTDPAKINADWVFAGKWNPLID